MFNLYFPDDKTEYIPSLIIVAVFVMVAVLTVRLIIKISKKEEEKAIMLEKQVLNNNLDNRELHRH